MHKNCYHRGGTQNCDSGDNCLYALKHYKTRKDVAEDMLAWVSGKLEDMAADYVNGAPVPQPKRIDEIIEGIEKVLMKPTKEEDESQ